MTSTPLAPAHDSKRTPHDKWAGRRVLVGFTGSAASKHALERTAELFPAAQLIIAYVDQDIFARIAQHLVAGDIPTFWGLANTPSELGRLTVREGVQLARALGVIADGLYQQTALPPVRALALLAEEHDADVIVLGRRRQKGIVERLHPDVASAFSRISSRRLLTVICEADATSAVGVGDRPGL